MKKKLCWEDFCGCSIASAARTRLGGRYVIKPDDTGFGVTRSFPSGGFATLQLATTLAEAQAIAQADYETR